MQELSLASGKPDSGSWQFRECHDKTRDTIESDFMSGSITNTFCKQRIKLLLIELMMPRSLMGGVWEQESGKTRFTNTYGLGI